MNATIDQFRERHNSVIPPIVAAASDEKPWAEDLLQAMREMWPAAIFADVRNRLIIHAGVVDAWDRIARMFEQALRSHRFASSQPDLKDLPADQLAYHADLLRGEFKLLHKRLLRKLWTSPDREVCRLQIEAIPAVSEAVFAGFDASDRDDQCERVKLARQMFDARCHFQQKLAELGPEPEDPAAIFGDWR